MMRTEAWRVRRAALVHPLEPEAEAREQDSGQEV